MASPIYGHVPTYLMQDGRSPLMVAAGAGRLKVAKLLLETHQINVKEVDSKVSEWPVMRRVSEPSSCAIVPTCHQVMQGDRTQRS